jgi:hypothetical protein
MEKIEKTDNKERLCSGLRKGGENLRAEIPLKKKNFKEWATSLASSQFLGAADI